MSAPSDCPEIACWQELFDDALPPDQGERCARHLESCPACQERLHRAEGLWGSLGRLGRQFGDPTRAPRDPLLGAVRQRLYGAAASLRADGAGPLDLSFLRPAAEPGVLGFLGPYEVR